MNFLRRSISGVLRVILAILSFFVGATTPLLAAMEQQPKRTIYLTRQQMRAMARKRANDYSRVLTHLPRRWRRRHARMLTKTLLKSMPNTIMV